MAKMGTPLQLNIIELLAEGKTRQEIAEILGCSVQSVSNAKNDEKLKQLYYEKCNDKVEALVPVAIKRLADILADDKQQGSVHVAAIREVLDRSHLKELLDVATKEVKVIVSYE